MKPAKLFYISILLGVLLFPVSVLSQLEVEGEKTFSLKSVNLGRGSSAGAFYRDNPQFLAVGTFAFDQTFRLKLDGKFEDVRVSASLTDTTSNQLLPFGGEDIWIKVEGRNFGATFGDYVSSFGLTDFTRYNRKLTGATGYVLLDKFRLSALGARVGGVPQRDEFKAEETRLVYTLTRRPVVEGSEVVKVDDEKLTREVDYTIDYITGTITFIEFLEADTEIVVEYEYLEGGLLSRRLIYGVEGEYKAEDFTAGLNYLTQNDEPSSDSLPKVENSPVQQSIFGANFEYNWTPASQKREIEIGDVSAGIVTISDRAEGWSTIPGEDGSSLTLETSLLVYKEAGRSLSFDYNLYEKDSKVWAVYEFDFPQDYSSYNQLIFWVYGDSNLERLSIELATDDSDYFHSPIAVINWDGWRQITFPIQSFEVAEGDPNLGDISSVKISLTSPEGALVGVSGLIYLDSYVRSSPYLPREEQISANISVEYGQSQYNPNTQNEAVIDDMEGDAKAFTLSDDPEDWEVGEASDLTSSIDIDTDDNNFKEGNSSLVMDYELAEEDSWVYIIYSLDDHDISKYDKLNFWLDGDNKGELLWISLVTEEDKEYSSEALRIDWTTWRTVRFELQEDFKLEDETELEKIKEIRLYLANDGTVSKSIRSTLYLDTLSSAVEKRWIIGGTGILDIKAINKELDPSFIPYSEESPQALDLIYTFEKEDDYVSITYDFNYSQDFTRYKRFKFAAFLPGDVLAGEVFVDLITSSNSYFRHKEKLVLDRDNIPKDKWKEVSLDIRADAVQDNFETYGSPTLEQIKEVRFSIERGEAEIEVEYSLYLDAVHLGGSVRSSGRAYKITLDSRYRDITLKARYERSEAEFRQIGKATAQAVDEEKFYMNTGYCYEDKITGNMRYESSTSTSRLGVEREVATTNNIFSTDWTFRFDDLPELKLGYQQKDKFNSRKDEGKINETVYLATFGLRYMVDIYTFEFDYRLQDTLDRTEKQPRTRVDASTYRISVAPSDKISSAVSYTKSVSRSEGENAPKTDTDTIALEVRAVPSRTLSLTGQYSSRVVSNLTDNTTQRADIADISTLFKPFSYLSGRVRYRLEQEERRVSGKKIPVDTSYTSFDLRVTPWSFISLSTIYSFRYTTADDPDTEEKIEVLKDNKRDWSLSFVPISSLTISGRCQASSRRDQYDKTTDIETTTVRIDNRFSDRLALKISYENRSKERGQKTEEAGIIKTMSRTSQVELGLDIIFSPKLSGELSYTWKGEKEPERDREDSSIIGAEIEYDINERMKVSSELEYTSVTGESAADKVKLALDLDYQLAENVELSAGYNYFTSSSASESDTYQANIFLLDVKLLF